MPFWSGRKVGLLASLRRVIIDGAGWPNELPSPSEITANLGLIAAKKAGDNPVLDP